MACQQTTQCHSSSCFLYAAGLVLGGAAIGYFIGFKNGTKKARMNTKIQLGNATVIDAVDAKDIGEQKGFCRCWKSEKFPYCDGAHVKHNQETGDNVGPLVVKGKR
ncbi:hypothetical protein Y032_0035g3135 [Ancylostoma ceylanicum]|uniref:Iron-binding zinc finger CDGSH type domain-containing protein n=1 Tax=Ancylostoma ceylanicum TaxID=53326 RepID=A0A016UML7_9BILA|nr:hypothetical protein Y032_0035g3135 [Ancylostoma ceylanicum]